MMIRAILHIYNGISITFWLKSDLCHNGSIVTIYTFVIFNRYRYTLKIKEHF